MQGIKLSQVGRIFALSAPSNSRGRRHGSKNKTKEERRVMIVSFVEKYKASNKGKFPTATLTFKEVGGSYYTVREILEELKQENVSCGTLGTDLEAIETKNQTRHTVEPLSLPAENANNGVIGSHYSLKDKEANYQEALSDTEEKKIAINNGVLETSGVNNQTQANEERKIVVSPLGSNPTSFVVDLQPLQGLPKRQSISSVSNGDINSNHHLKLSEALSDTEEQGNIIHNDVEIHDPNDQTQAKKEIKIGERPPRASAASIARDEQGNIIHNVVEICYPNDQTQAKQEIKIGERPPRASAASIARDLEVLLQVIGEPGAPAQSDHLEEASKGEVSSASIGVRDNNHSLALEEAEYLEILSDTEEQKIITQNDVTRNFGPNDQTQAKQETKIVERPQGPSVQPLQEMMEGQSISNVTGGFMDNNHMLELNETKCQEALSDAEEQKNIIHNDVETCGRTPNDQAQLKQEITIIEESPGTSATSNPPAALEYHEGGEEHLYLDTSKPLSLSSDSRSTTCVSKQPKDLSFSAQHEDDNNLVLNSTEGIPEEPAIPADKIISPLTNSVTALQEATEIPDNVLDDQKLAASNISSDQVLTGVKVHAEDASQKGSSEFQSENSDGYSIDLSDKKETASVLSSSSLDQGGSICDTVQSTHKINSDGYCASNSEKKISSYQDENTGDTMQISHNFSEGNNAPTLENEKRTYENTESSNDREKMETNILGFVSNIVKGILYLLKK